MSQRRWIMSSPQFIKTFIEIYKKHVCLWNSNDQTYTNKYLRSEGCRELLQFCRAYDPTATMITVRNKINNIRCAFRKEMKKVLQSQESGAPDGIVYIPKLWYYDLFLFTVVNQQEKADNNLSDTMKSEHENGMESNGNEMEDENSLSNSSAMLDSNNHSANHLATPSKSPTTYLPIKRKRSEDEDPPAQPGMSDDEFDAIGKLIACKLRRMAEGQRDIAEHLLNNLLYYGLRNRLDDLTFICLSQAPPNTAPAGATAYDQAESA